jgi:hypothetical protein
MKFIGYLNERSYSDITSYKVMSDGKKYFAVNVKKVVGDTKPQMKIEGFIAHCNNISEVWSDPTCEIVEEGDLFEIEFKRGYWGYKDFDARSYPHGMIVSVGENQEIEHGEKYDMVYQLTPTRRRKTVFTKIAKEIEQECKYYYDYNF